MFTVLIVDDESIERKYLSGVFLRQKDRYQVVAEAENGEQAVKLAALYRPDIIIMDINIPLLNGLEAAKRIRQDAPDRIIVLNSAYAEFEFARQAVEYNLDAYLLKPAQEEVIFATIASCLRKKSLQNRREESRNVESGGLESLELTDLNQNGTNYPYDIVDRILEAVASASPHLLKSNSTLYLNFLKAQNQKLDHYRLYVINTLFSIEQVLRHAGVPGNLVALLDCSRYLLRIGRSSSWQEIRETVEEFFSNLALLLESGSPPGLSGTDLVADYIAKNYAKNITLDELADLAKFSPAYLSRLFHEQKGLTIRSYINKKRIAQAVYLLQHSTRKTRDIAGDCGFDNLSHFHQVFREHTGKTPVEIRKKQAGEKERNL